MSIQLSYNKQKFAWVLINYSERKSKKKDNFRSSFFSIILRGLKFSFFEMMQWEKLLYKTMNNKSYKIPNT